MKTLIFNYKFVFKQINVQFLPIETHSKWCQLETHLKWRHFYIVRTKYCFLSFNSSILFDYYLIFLRNLISFKPYITDKLIINIFHSIIIILPNFNLNRTIWQLFPIKHSFEPVNMISIQSELSCEHRFWKNSVRNEL